MVVRVSTVPRIRSTLEIFNLYMKRTYMKYLLIILLLPISLIADENPKTYEDYKLVWSEEFEKDGALSEEDWKFEQGFVRNYEMQWYQKENAFCKDGKLIIEGRKEYKENPNFKATGDWKQKRKFIYYSSSSVMTKKSWQYGRFEVRAKIKAENGLWPAIWTLGVNGSWPSNGEVDIMEYYDNSILANTAWGTTKKWVANWQTEKKKLSYFNDPDFDSKFHVWRMDWDVNSIKIYLDGKLLNHTDLSRTINPTNWGPKNPFRQPHYLLLNLAMGGRSGGSLKNTTFPSRYEIDYVRVYQSTLPQPKEKKFVKKEAKLYVAGSDEL